MKKSGKPRLFTTQLFYNLIKEHGPIDRQGLVKLTNSKMSTVYGYLKPLVKENKIEKFKISNRRLGRSRIYYRINGKQ